MNWNKIEIKTENGEKVFAQAPVIVSASRATDIPAFYSDWFFECLEKGYLKWKNPFNGVPLYVSFKNTRLIVFWSKNPKPVIKHLDYLKKNINYYFQFTLNDYDKENLERNVPKLEKRIETFIELSEKIGREKVIWRFDPLFMTNELGVDELLKKVENIGNQLKNYTKKINIISEHKADLNYISVGCASILAKVTRDRMITSLIGNLSGYPSDPKTIEYLKKYLLISVIILYLPLMGKMYPM